MNQGVNKNKVVKSLFWKYLEMMGKQGIGFVISIILARILSPDDYGVVALTAIFLTISAVFVESGLNSALIQKKETDNKDFNAVFTLSLIIASVLYILIYTQSGNIANYFSEPILANVLRILPLTLFIAAFTSVFNAKIARNMQFKKTTISTIAATIVSGSIGIYMAINGYGVWALVVQQLVMQLVNVIILAISTRWLPRLYISYARIKPLFSFSWKMLLSSLIDVIYNEARGLIIGKQYSSKMLGYYNKGRSLPNQIITGINGSLQHVLFPTMASFQSEPVKIKNTIRKAIRVSTYVVFPIMVGLAAAAEPMVRVLLTDKWLPSVPYIRFFCFSFALWPIHTTNLQAIKASGRSDIFLKLEIIKKIVGITAIIITIPFGVYYIGLSVPITGVLGAIINTYPSKKLFDYSIKELIKDILPAMLVSAVMGIAVYLLNYLQIDYILLLAIQIAAGVIIYIGLSILFRIKSFRTLVQLIRRREIN